MVPHMISIGDDDLGDFHSQNRIVIAPFLEKLSTILSVEDSSIISWSPDGKAFEVHKPEEFSKSILPKYFRHGKYASFQRQLNYFGFKKMSKSKAAVSTYYRPYFTRDNPDGLKMIKRKTAHKSPRGNASLNRLEPQAPSPTSLKRQASFGRMVLPMKHIRLHPMMDKVDMLNLPNPYKGFDGVKPFTPANLSHPQVVFDGNVNLFQGGMGMVQDPLSQQMDAMDGADYDVDLGIYLQTARDNASDGSNKAVSPEMDLSQVVQGMNLWAPNSAGQAGNAVSMAGMEYFQFGVPLFNAEVGQACDPSTMNDASFPIDPLAPTTDMYN